MKTIRIGCRDRGPSWAGNDHDIVLVREDERAFYGYPAGRKEEWERNHWGELMYPKYAWIALDVSVTKSGAP